MLFSTFHVHAALKLAPILPQNRKKCRWCALSAALPQKQAPFLFRYFNNNNASFQWQFYDQRRRRLYHTLLWHGCRGRWTKGLCKKCGYFLSHRTLKIPSSINKPVPGSKIVEKTEQEKMHEFSNHCWLVNISTASTTWTIILMSASSPCKQTHYWPCRFDAVDLYTNFFFSSCDPVSCWTLRDEIFATQQTTW